MEKILLVEDSKSFAAILSNSITQRWQIPVECAYSLEDALRILQEADGSVVLAIIDVNLPDAPDGAAVDEVLAYGIPGIVFTAQLNDQLRDQILAKGVADYVLKQGAYNIDYVVNMVGRLLKNRSISTLVVSSDAEKRNQIGNWLAGQNLQVLETASGMEALAILQQTGQIQVLIVDFALQDIPCYSLVAKVRERHDADSLVIIGISSIHERNTAVHFIKSGANDVLAYPFLPEEMSCRVNRSLNQIEHFHRLVELNQHKNRLMGMAAHDIRGPVGNIASACKMLRSDKLKPERRDELFGMVRQASDDVLRLLNDLLDVSAIESGRLTLEYKALDLRELLMQRVRTYEPAAQQKNIVFNTRCKSCPPIQGDASRLTQVIDNLLSNAIKFSPRGGLVDVKLEQRDDVLRLCVIDQGAGIPPSEVTKLFKPFSTVSTKPTEGESSTGLGLAICKSIINQHGGEIGLDEAHTKGAGFYFTLPL